MVYAIPGVEPVAPHWQSDGEMLRRLEQARAMALEHKRKEQR